MSATIPVPLSVVALDLASAFTDIAVPADVHGLLADLELNGPMVHGYRIVDRAAGRVVQLLLGAGSGRQARMVTPQLSGFELVAEFGDGAVLEVSEPRPHAPYSELHDLRLAVRFDPAVLRPLDGSARAELSWTGSLRLHPDWRIALLGDPELTLSPCEIVGTGIVVELAGVQIDVSGESSPPPIRALNLDAGFRGVYARSGSLRLLPQARFGSFDGIRVDIRDLAIGNSGVTGTVGRYFDVSNTDGVLDAGNPLNGQLFDGAWQIGIGAVEVSLLDSAVTHFLVAGLVRVPLIDALLELSFGLRQIGAGYETTLHIGNSGPLRIEIGDGGLDVAGFALDGTFGGPDAIAVSGVVEGIELGLAPLQISAAQVAIAVRHSPGLDELRVELNDVPLGPLGTLDAIELVVSDKRAGATIERRVQLEGSIAWDDLRGRLDLPAGVPEPAGGHAHFVLSWDEDATGARRVIVRLSAGIDDLESLVSFVPTGFRPQIEQADLNVEIVYPSAAAFTATSASAPLSGSASISMIVRLPMLPTLPGVLDVRMGDATGRVRATLATTLDAGNPQILFALTDPVAIDLTLPGQRTGAPVVTLGLTSIAVAAVDGARRSRFSLAGHVSAPAMDDYLTRTAADLGLPAGLTELLQPLGSAMPTEGSFALDVELDGATVAPSIELAFRASDSPSFRLLEALGKVVNPDATQMTGATPLPGLGIPGDFFEVSPGELRLSATLTNPPSFKLSGSLDTTVLGETFDMTLSISADQDDFEIAVTAGMTDPILITAPIPDPTALLGGADASAIAAAYGLDGGARAELVRIEQLLTDVAAELGSQGVLAFEISNLSLGVTPTGPKVDGQVRLVQLPRFMEVLTPLSELQLGLGAEIDKIYVTVERKGGDANGPLLTVPLPGDVNVAVFFRSFILAYAWGRNELAFALDANVVPSETLDMTLGGSGVLLPAVDADIQLGATVSAPPAPLPEGILSFVPPVRHAGSRAVDELGLQAVIGAGETRFLTAYVRELAFSPTYFLLWPGFSGDGGLVLGGPNPRDLPSAEAYLDVRSWDRGSFFARFTVQHGTLIFFDSFLGVMLNPLAAVPPFLTANPPYWIVPPFIMGDLYADEIGVSVNLPGLAFFDLTFQRPLPSFSLQALLELAALAAGGFTHVIPAGSPLFGVFFARLQVVFEVQLPFLSGAGRAAPITVEINVADLINGLIDVLQKAKSTLAAGSDLIGEVSRDPAALIRMIPPDTRRVQHDIVLGGFTFSGSLYLLAPDELLDELVLFFENKRRRPRGLAANRTAGSPPRIAPVNQRPVLVDSELVRWPGIVDARSLEPDMTAVGRKAAALVGPAARARTAALDGLLRDRKRNVDDSAAAIADALLAIPAGDVRARNAVLVGFGISELAGRVDAAFSKPRRPGGPGGTGASDCVADDHRRGDERPQRRDDRRQCLVSTTGGGGRRTRRPHRCPPGAAPSRRFRARCPSAAPGRRRPHSRDRPTGARASLTKSAPGADRRVRHTRTTTAHDRSGNGRRRARHRRHYAGDRRRAHRAVRRALPEGRHAAGPQDRPGLPGGVDPDRRAGDVGAHAAPGRQDARCAHVRRRALRWRPARRGPLPAPPACGTVRHGGDRSRVPGPDGRRAVRSIAANRGGDV
ncbi:MAG: hypothetical protein R2761_05885 [Acidimicrobiales bacterium]